MLVWLAAASLAAAVAIGVGAALAWTLWLLPFVAAGAFLVPAYTLELAGGIFHSDLWFGLAWGAFPVLVAYLGAAETLRPEAFSRPFSRCSRAWRSARSRRRSGRCGVGSRR